MKATGSLPLCRQFSATLLPLLFFPDVQKACVHEGWVRFAHFCLTSTPGHWK